MKSEHFPEILSPCGTPESIDAAVNNGCDAIYLGGKNFNARQSASNFADNDLKNVIDYCHLRNIKVLIALNILYKENEINDVLKFVSKMYSYGADAFIIQDIGIFNIIKQHFKNIKLHASTQMTVHNISGINFLYNAGFNRVVLSRELSLNEIKSITEYINKNSMDIEIEVFVHGALCVSYSGRCLMSSSIGERSGNRGRCAQPCRMKYKLLKNDKVIKDDYLISPKDILTIEILDKLVNSGINTFKIEGRMKSPEYVAQATKTYRKYIDKIKENNFEIDTKDIRNLTQIFNRGGNSTTGYFENWAGKQMISPAPKSSGVCIGIVEKYDKQTQKCTIFLSDYLIAGDGIEIWTKEEPHVGTNINKKASPNDKIVINIKGNINKGDLVFKSYNKELIDNLKRTYAKQTRQQTVIAVLRAKSNSPLYMHLTSENGTTAEEIGNIVETAENQPITKDKLLTQLSKTGGTPFKIEFKECEIDDDIYIPISIINSFRRNIVQKLENNIIQSYRRKTIDVKYNTEKLELSNKKKITVYLNKKEQFEIAVQYNIKRIYLEYKSEFINNINYYIQKASENNIELFISLPRILREPLIDEFKNNFNKLENSSIDGYLFRNYTDIKTNKKLAADYSFNVFNCLSKQFLFNYFDTLTLSTELNITELNTISGNNTEVCCYGYIPVMTTHQCPIGLYDGDKDSGRFCRLKENEDIYYLRDRKNIDFPVITDCKSCLATILNSSPIFILNKFNNIISSKINYLRLDFTIETAEETDKIIYSYLQLLNDGKADTKTSNLISLIREKGFTTGHFFRGVL